MRAASKEGLKASTRSADDKLSENGSGGSGARAPAHPELILGLVLFSASLWLYVRTLYPTIAGGDATEFAFHTCQWGVPHPPGYPTFAIASNMVNMLLGPVFRAAGVASSPAHRANLTSALFGAGANVGVFLAGCGVTGYWGYAAARKRPASAGPQWLHPGLWASFLCACTFAISRLHWHYSLQSEVFSLNALFAAALFLINSRLEATRDVSWAFVGSFLSGLGLTNQHTLALLVAPISVHAVARHPRDLLSPRGLGRLFQLFGLGLLPYAYLVPASMARLPGSWGDQTTVTGFLRHFLRLEYGAITLYSGLDGTSRGQFLLPALSLYARDLSADTWHVGWALVLLTGVALARHGTRRWPGATIAAISWVFSTSLFLYLANLPLTDGLYVGVLERFFIQSHTTAYIVMAPGLSMALNALGMTFADGEAAIDVAKLAEEPKSKKRAKGPRSDPAREQSTKGRGVADAPREAATAKGGAGAVPAQCGGGEVRTVTAAAAVVATLSVVVWAGMARLPAMDESQNWAIYRGVAHVMATLPPQARLMMHGDYRSNGLRYLRQCEGLRTDVELLEIQMSTYPWFWKMQRGNVPSFVLPEGTAMYHPRKAGGYSMETFVRNQLEAPLVYQDAPTGEDRVRGPLMLTGGWHVQDSTQAGHFTALPWGGTDLVLPASGTVAWFTAHPGHLDAWVRRTRELLPPLEDTMFGVATVRDDLGSQERRERALRKLAAMRGKTEPGGEDGDGSGLPERPGARAVVHSTEMFTGPVGESTPGEAPLDRLERMSSCVTSEGRGSLATLRGWRVEQGEARLWVGDRRRWEWQAEAAMLSMHLDRAAFMLSWVEQGAWRTEGGEDLAVDVLREVIATFEALLALWPDGARHNNGPVYMFYRSLGSAYSQLRYITRDRDTENDTARAMRAAYAAYSAGLDAHPLAPSDPVLREHLMELVEGRVPW